MRTIIQEHKLEFFSNSIFNEYFAGKKLAVFDIETLGLNASRESVILAGILDVDKDGNATAVQYFLDSPDEEAVLLAVLKEELNKYDVLLTFNGRHFDLPYIKKRAEVLGLEDYEIRPYNLDLFQILQGQASLKAVIGKLSQKNVERYLGISAGRDDEISGADSVLMFKEYLTANDSDRKDDLARQILLHNHDDIVQLYRLLPIIRQTDFHKSMMNRGFIIEGINGWPDLNTGKIKLSTRGMIIPGTYDRSVSPYSLEIGKIEDRSISYLAFSAPDFPFDVEFKADGTFSFKLSVQLVNGNFIVNLRKDLGYDLDMEDSPLDSKCMSHALPLHKLPGFVNGFLILGSRNAISCREVNSLSAYVIRSFMAANPCPLID